MDKIEGYLEVGTNGNGEIVVNHPGMKADADGVGHYLFSPRQAREFANILLKKAVDAERETGTAGILHVACPKCGAKDDGSLCVNPDGTLLSNERGLAAHIERDAARRDQKPKAKS